MNTEIRIIPHKQQRYETVGDWYFIDGTLFIFVSDLGDWRYNFLVAFHEQAEAMLCLHRGISEMNVTIFDKWYENERAMGNKHCQAEPGDHKMAPYRKEHFFATSVERLMAAELKVDWEDYDAAIEAL